MKQVTYDNNWPDAWKYSYKYDLQEVYGQVTKLGYAYAYQNRYRATLDLITEVVPQGSRILDVAAAQGNFSLALAERGYRVTWNDLRGDLQGYVELKHEHGDLSFAPGNAFELEFEEPFDCVLIAEVIEHVAHPDDFLRKVGHLVKPGGHVVMTTPNGAYFRNTLPRFSDCPHPEQFESEQFGPNSENHIFLLWPDEIVSLAEQGAGLRVEKTQMFTTPLTNGHVKLHKILPYVPKSIVFAIDAVARRLPSPIANRLLVHTATRYIRPADC